MRRVLIGRVVATSAALVLLVGTFLPWITSGRRRRSSYQIFSLIERIGYPSSSAVGWALRLWPLLPLLTVAAITILWFHRPAMAAGVGGLAAAYATIVAVAVLTSSPSPLIDIEYGPIVTLVGAADFAVGLVFSIRAGSQECQAPRASST
ncbi:MAG TPA: hypothetical protein VH761_00825 [Ilumatobacteraceae bacterium]